MTTASESGDDVSEYTEAVNKLAEQVVSETDCPPSEDAFSEAVREVVLDSQWHTAHPLRTLQNSSQNPDNLPYTPPWYTNIDLGGSYQEWDEVLAEVSYLCLFNDVMLKAEELKENSPEQ